MFWLQALLLSQGLECPLEPEVRLPPHSDFRPFVLNRTKSAKGFEAWSGAQMTVQRRTSDGAVGLLLAGRQVPLKPMGLLGVEGTGQMPLGEHGFATSPIAVRIFRNALLPGAASVTIQATATFYLAARCAGRLALSPWDGKGPRGFDANGDGKVEPNSPAEFARISNAVFELHGNGYQMQGVDWKKRALILNETELGPGFHEGESLVDFAYTDRLNQRKLLSSHGDSWTLIDFWASWCGPCVAAFPQLKLITESHSLSILGLNGDEDANAASRMLAQFEVLWPDVQATEPSSLMDYRFRVALYPTYLLIDPSRKIVARTESTLELLELIRRLVPKRQMR